MIRDSGPWQSHAVASAALYYVTEVFFTHIKHRMGVNLDGTQAFGARQKSIWYT